MKRINFYLDNRSLVLNIEEQASIIDVIMQVEKQEDNPKYRLLYTVYNPKKKRFYSQIGIHAYTEDRKFINLREEPLQKLPDHSTVYLSTKGPCVSDFEPKITYEEFLKEIKKVKD